MNESNPKLQASEQRPWTVIVRDGLVVARYRAEDSYATDAEVNHVTLNDGPVDVYEVDADIQPPNVGQPVHDEDLQRWTRAKPSTTECSPTDCSPTHPTD